jgi:hypothetical protein
MKQIEYEHYLFQWKRGSINYGVFTTCPKIAKILRRRKDSIEFKDITFPLKFKGNRFWLFTLTYSTYQSARKSINRLLDKHSYSRLEYNRVNDEYQSISYTNCTLKNGSEVANAS